jgi:hypothetical protein
MSRIAQRYTVRIDADHRRLYLTTADETLVIVQKRKRVGDRYVWSYVGPYVVEQVDA